MKTCINLLIVSLAAAIFYPPAYGKTAYKKVTLNLVGRTGPIKYTIKENTVTVKIRNEGTGNWLYTQNIYARGRKVKNGYIYTFSLSAGIRSMAGRNLIAYASANLNEGGKIYEEWKIETGGSSGRIHSSVKLFKLEGLKEKGINDSKRKSAEKKEIYLSVYGRTPQISELPVNNSFTIRIRERKNKKWIYRKRITPEIISDSTGNIYIVHFNDKLMLTGGKPIQIEVFATLEDGREIFGAFFSNLTFPENRLNISLGINSYRGAKNSAESPDILDPDEITLEGRIILPGRTIRRLKNRSDSLPPGFNSTLVIKDISGNQLISIKVPMKPHRRGSYRGILTGVVQLRRGVERVKAEIYILTRRGRQVYTGDIILEILTRDNRKKIIIRESLERIK
jgi:hypothetical protein